MYFWEGPKKEVFAISYKVVPHPHGIYPEETQPEQPITDTKFGESTYRMLRKQPNLIFVVQL